MRGITLCFYFRLEINNEAHISFILLLMSSRQWELVLWLHVINVPGYLLSGVVQAANSYS